MWRTIFVIGHKRELKPSKSFPSFTKGGEIMLYKTDLFDNSRVPFRYSITQVIYDVISTQPTQYVHLLEIIDGE